MSGRYPQTEDGNTKPGDNSDPVVVDLMQYRKTRKIVGYDAHAKQKIKPVVDNTAGPTNETVK